VIVKAWKVGNKWLARIEDEDSNIIIESATSERRVGCAVRLALNTFQLRYGQPTLTEVQFDFQDW
jgi:hypothetical protein